MKYIGGIILAGSSIVFLIGGIFWYMRTPQDAASVINAATSSLRGMATLPPEKTAEERVKEAEERSSNIKGLYMTPEVANDQGRAATRLRETIVSLAEKTEINGIVIDVKEVCGPDYSPDRLKTLVETLHKKNIWAIARIVAFKDASQINAHPEWYIRRQTPKPIPEQGCANKKYLRAKSPSGEAPSISFWQDKKGGYWLDPASPGAREYIAGFARKMIDLGFDELQFDYIRFPSDGDVSNAVYPAWDRKTEKEKTLKSFFEYLNTHLKGHKPEIILSADLFGYVASAGGDKTIGQNLADIGNAFDYVSFMVYPSHYYNGLVLAPQPDRNLPALHFSLEDARKNPGTVVYRSLVYARDFLNGKIALSIPKSGKREKLTATTSAAGARAASSPAAPPLSKTKFRPWLEDFFHESDRNAGRPSGAEKVRLQIDAAERAENHGWLLWNSQNVYTEGALKKE